MNKTIPYNRTKFLLGGIYAALLPILIGLGLLAHIITQQIGDYEYWMIVFPVIISLIFIAPIVALICVSHLRKNAPLNREDILTASFIESTKANFWTAIVFNFILFAAVLFTTKEFNSFLNAFSSLLSIVVFIQLVLWLMITLPLSFICTIIFELIVRPKKNA